MTNLYPPYPGPTFSVFIIHSRLTYDFFSFLSRVFIKTSLSIFWRTTARKQTQFFFSLFSIFFSLCCLFVCFQFESWIYVIIITRCVFSFTGRRKKDCTNSKLQNKSLCCGCANAQDICPCVRVGEKINVNRFSMHRLCTMHIYNFGSRFTLGHFNENCENQRAKTYRIRLTIK